VYALAYTAYTAYRAPPPMHMVPAGIKTFVLDKNSAIVDGAIDGISSLLLYSKSPPCLKTCAIRWYFLWQI